MSLHAGLVMLRTDARQQMRRVFELFDQRPLEMQAVNGWNAALEAIRYPRDDSPRTTVHKAVAFCNGWTVVLDPSLIMPSEQEPCWQLAAEFHAAVFSMVCEGTSGTYEFALHEGGASRVYSLVDGEVSEDRGQPIPQEAGIDLAKLSESDVLLIMERLGVSYSSLEATETFEIWALDEIWTLDESDVAPPEPSAPKTPGGSGKPWWKVW